MWSTIIGLFTGGGMSPWVIVGAVVLLGASHTFAFVQGGDIARDHAEVEFQKERDSFRDAKERQQANYVKELQKRDAIITRLGNRISELGQELQTNRERIDAYQISVGQLAWHFSAAQAADPDAELYLGGCWVHLHDARTGAEMSTGGGDPESACDPNGPYWHVGDNPPAGFYRATEVLESIGRNYQQALTWQLQVDGWQKWQKEVAAQ